MKKIIALLAICTVLFTSCADNKTINGTTYRPYGLLNEKDARNPEIHYAISPAAAISGVVFSECFFIPTVYTYGFNLWEPVSTEAEFQGKPAQRGVKN